MKEKILSSWNKENIQNKQLYIHNSKTKIDGNKGHMNTDEEYNSELEDQVKGISERNKKGIQKIKN